MRRFANRLRVRDTGASGINLNRQRVVRLPTPGCRTSNRSPQMVQPIPEGYHSITPYLIVKGGARAIDFYKRAFGATELFRMDGPNGTVGHAEIKIGNSVVMLADEHPQMGARSPETIGGTPVSLLLYVENVDQVVERAVKEGAKLQQPIENKFYGDRMGGVADPFGHTWYLATHVEDVSPDEMQKRAAAAGAQM
jgi:PhnB protein